MRAWHSLSRNDLHSCGQRPISEDSEIQHAPLWIECIVRSSCLNESKGHSRMDCTHNAPPWYQPRSISPRSPFLNKVLSTWRLAMKNTNISDYTCNISFWYYPSPKYLHFCFNFVYQSYKLQRYGFLSQMVLRPILNTVFWKHAHWI